MKINIEWLYKIINIKIKLIKILYILEKIGIEINYKKKIYENYNKYYLYAGLIKNIIYKKNKIILFIYNINNNSNNYIYIKNNNFNLLINNIILIIKKNIKDEIYLFNKINNFNFIKIINFNNNTKKNIKKILLKDILLDLSLPSNRIDLNSVIGISKEVLNYINNKEKKKYNIYYKNINYTKNFIFNIKLNIKNKIIKNYIFRIIDNIFLTEEIEIFIQERLIKNNISLSTNPLINIMKYIYLETGVYINILDIKNNKKYIKKNIEKYINNENYFLYAKNNFYINNYKKHKKKQKLLIIFVSILNKEKNYNYINENIFYKNNFSIISPKKIINKIIELIKNISLNKKKIICSNFIIHSKKIYYRKIKFNIKNFFSKIGYYIDIKKIYILLDILDIKYKLMNKLIIKLYIPEYKCYIITEEDIIEEIIKYNNLLNKKNIKNNLLEFKYIDKIDLINKIKCILINKGYYEVITNPLVNKNIIEKIKNNNTTNNIINIINPISIKESCLRENLIYGLLNTLIYNINKKIEYIKIFEEGKCFKYNNNVINEFNIISGIFFNIKKYNSIYFRNKNIDFLDIKGYIEYIINITNIKNYKFVQTNNILLDTKLSLNIINDDKKVIGYIGYLNRNILNLFNISKEIIIFEINLETILNNNINSNIKINHISKYPIIKRDISIIINNIEINNIYNYIYKYKKKNIEYVDIYIIDNFIKNNNFIITFRIILQGYKENLNNNQINNILNSFVYDLNKHYKCNIIHYE